MKSKPSIEYIRSILSYDPLTGLFTWLESRGSVMAGSPAGAKVISRGKPYINIKIDRRLIKAHHIAWAIHHGEWPDFDLDHDDGDGANNRIVNLRKCSMSQNKANSKTYKNNTTGYKGVYFDGIVYRVSIQKDGKRLHVGRYRSIDEAAAAYWATAKKLFGEFARAA